MCSGVSDDDDDDDDEVDNGDNDSTISRMLFRPDSTISERRGETTILSTLLNPKIRQQK